MSLEEKKIKSYADNIKSLSDYPSEDGISACELKAMFDGRGDKEIKSSINGIIDELASHSAASQIGSAAGNVQRELDLKVDAENGEVFGNLFVTTETGEGCITIKPAIYDGQAEIKLSDMSGPCATLGMDFDGKLTVSYGNDFIEEREKEGEVYTSLSHPKLDLVSGEALNIGERMSICHNLGLDEQVMTHKINLNGAEFTKDGNEVVIYRPMENGVPESALKIGYDLMFDNGDKNHLVYHSGNLKDLTQLEANLSDNEKRMVLKNTGLDLILGDVEQALDAIIALQEAYIGGESA